MINLMNLINKKTAEQFSSYFITGISGTALDIATLYFLKNYFNLSAVTAIIINQIIVLNYIFLINKHWVFKTKCYTKDQIFKFYGVMGFNYLISIGWMWLFNSVFSFNYILVRIANIALSVSWNFLLYKLWVFKDHSNLGSNLLPHSTASQPVTTDKQ